MVIEHCFRASTTGKFLKTCIEDLVLESGLYGSLWDMPFDIISQYVSHYSIIYYMYHYNYENDITITIPHGCIKKQRENDKSIISVAIQMLPTTSFLRAINRIRMFLGLVHISDLCHSNGSKLDLAYKKTTCQPRWIYIYI